MLLMLAGAEIDFPLDPGADVDAHAEWCGKALWLFDRVVKNYLVRCWNFVGVLSMIMVC